MTNRIPTLIVNSDPMAAALLGLLVESMGGNPVYPRAGESVEDAMPRAKSGRVLVAAADPALASDLFFAAARRSHLEVVVYGDVERVGLIAAVAAERAVGWMIVPGPAEAIQPTPAKADRKRAGPTDRRREPETTITEDGTPILRDGQGARWLVYDRRSSTGRRQPDDSIERSFVGETGQRVVCQIPAAASGDLSGPTLDQQVSHATPSSGKGK